MKYFRFTLFWALVASVVNFGATFANIGESTNNPYESMTGSMIERVLSDKLAGIPSTISDRPAYMKRLAKHLYRLCGEHELDPAMVLSLVQVESRFRADVVSSAGAIGLMQVMPDTAGFVARRKLMRQDLKDPFVNLELGMIYLRALKDRYAGEDPYFHFAAYNMGPHRLDTLRAKPGFKPGNKSMKYFTDIMRGVTDWRHYGFQSLPIELKSKTDVARKTLARNTDPV